MHKPLINGCVTARSGENPSPMKCAAVCGRGNGMCFSRRQSLSRTTGSHRLPGAACWALLPGVASRCLFFSLLGASCTVLDYSTLQLESEKAVAQREGYAIEMVQADMTKPFPFEGESFDCIFHPVSNCYVEEVEPVWRECFRVLKPGGVLLAGVDNGINYLFEEDSAALTRPLPFNPLRDEELYRTSVENGDGIQFSHTTEEQLRPLLRTGFRLLDLYEDTNGYGVLEAYRVPTFLAFLAQKP